MSQKYDITIQLNPTVTSNKRNIQNGIIFGIAELPGTDLVTMTSTNRIFPLDKYLEKNKVWNSLPQSFRDLYKIDGQTWGIAKGYTPDTNARVIRSDWLKETGLQTPTTLDEFLTVCKDITEIKDSTGRSNMPLGDFVGMSRDIFGAFGIQLNSYSKNAIAYDPKEGKFVDGMSKPQAKDALEYMRSLYQSGYMDKSSFSANSEELQTKTREGQIGSFLTSPLNAVSGLGWQLAEKQAGRTLKIENSQDFDYGSTFLQPLSPLTGSQTTQISPYFYSSNAYCLTANTQDPEQTVNMFVDMAFGSKTGFLDFYAGIPDNYTYYQNEGVIVMNQDSKSVRLVDPIDQVFDSTSFMFFDTLPSKELHDRCVSIYKARSEFIDENKKNGKLYELLPIHSSPISRIYSYQTSRIDMAFVNLMTKAITDNSTTVDNALTEYNGFMKALRVEQILKEANENLSK